MRAATLPLPGWSLRLGKEHKRSRAPAGEPPLTARMGRDHVAAIWASACGLPAPRPWMGERWPPGGSPPAALIGGTAAHASYVPQSPPLAILPEPPQRRRRPVPRLPSWRCPAARPAADRAVSRAASSASGSAGASVASAGWPPPRGVHGRAREPLGARRKQAAGRRQRLGSEGHGTGVDTPRWGKRPFVFPILHTAPPCRATPRERLSSRALHGTK